MRLDMLVNQLRTRTEAVQSGSSTRMARFASTLVAAIWLAACASSTSTLESGELLQQRTDTLAAELFAPSSSAASQRIGIGSIVPVHSLRQEGNSRDRVLVQQIQEGIMSSAVQRGAHVVEYRTSSQLRFDNGQELMLSRDVEELSARQRLDYFLTGTYSEVSGGLLVNLRLINVRDNSVAQAATQFFPWAGLSDDGELSEIRHGQLYRHSVAPSEPRNRPSQSPLRANRYRQP